jgi:endonuclease G
LYFIAILFGLLVSCQQTEAPEVLSLSTRAQYGLAKGGYTFVEVGAAGDWTLSLDFMGETQWAKLTQTSGTGENNGIILTYDKNTGDHQRSLNLILSGENDQVTCTFVQMTSVVNLTVASDPVGEWLELPEVDNPDYYFFTHFFTHRNERTRNYSYYWDVENLVAHWVAYPLNDGLVGTGSRTDEWGLDPKLPRNMQPVLYKGFKGGYDRGHQLPSADRLTREANVQTFYGTNMTPQLGRLNQQGWAALEGAVRDWSRKMDTLYVVTGCLVDESTKVAYDNDGKAVTVPTAYFKALLGYKKDLSVAATTGGYSAIGFYYPHEAYSGGYMEKSLSIDELETKTGMDFFVHLPAKIGQEMANSVESKKASW